MPEGYKIRLILCKEYFLKISYVPILSLNDQWTSLKPWMHNYLFSERCFSPLLFSISHINNNISLCFFIISSTKSLCPAGRKVQSAEVIQRSMKLSGIENSLKVIHLKRKTSFCISKKLKQCYQANFLNADYYDLFFTVLFEL